MTSKLKPGIWLIVLLIGLPQLSETVYSPFLPSIALSLQTSESLVEYTLTIYLLGFAIGTLFWGKISDDFGRKPCVILGLFIFIIGCLGCYLSATIQMLMLSRLVQAFGGSIGSVLGQAICRDAFQGADLGRVYSTTGSARSVFPALGPLFGGIVAQNFGWENIFTFLILFAIILAYCIFWKLPETHHRSLRKKIAPMQILSLLSQDKKVIGFAFIIAGCNGILFSYFAEGPFYLINILGLSPSKYGLSFILIASATMGGGLLSRFLQSYQSSKKIMKIGVYSIFFSTVFFSIFILTQHVLKIFSQEVLIGITIFSQMICAFGTCMAGSNALSLALKDYKYAIGTASSFFGFFYYLLISLVTFIMGFLHNGTLLPMPIYFLGISALMIITINTFLKEA